MKTYFAIFLFALSFGAQAFEGPDFRQLERALKLRPHQKAQFDAAVASTQRAMLSVGLATLEVKERLKAEFAKPRPDLNILYGVHEQVLEQTRPLFREAREEWSRLYSLMDDDQVAVARAFVENQLSLFLPSWR